MKSVVASIDIQIVTISHFHRPFIERNVPLFLDGIRKVSGNVLVIDNANDGTAAWADGRDPRLSVICNEAPRGFAANTNQAIARRQSRYVALVNPDVVPEPGLFRGLVEFMDQNPGVAVAGPLLRNPDGSIQVSARAFSTPLVVLIRGLRLDRFLGWTPAVRDYLRPPLSRDRACDVDWVTGAVMIVRRAAIDAVGPMDERYFLYSEDQDWCCRFWRAGWRVAYVPTVSATHVHLRDGIRKPSSAAARHQFVSAIRMFHKFGWRLSRAAP